jgi:predicted ester cyclase
MSTNEDIKAYARRMVEALNHENWRELIVEFLSTPAVADEFIQQHATFRTAFPDYHFTIDDLIAEGDKVVVRGTVRATHRDEYPFAELKDIAPTGKQLDWEEVWIFSRSDSTDFWMLIDGVSRLQQLGVLPSSK